MHCAESLGHRVQVPDVQVGDDKGKGGVISAAKNAWKKNGIDSKVCPHKGDIIYWPAKRAVENK